MDESRRREVAAYVIAKAVYDHVTCTRGGSLHVYDQNDDFLKVGVKGQLDCLVLGVAVVDALDEIATKRGDRPRYSS